MANLNTFNTSIMTIDIHRIQPKVWNMLNKVLAKDSNHIKNVSRPAYTIYKVL